MPTNNDDIDYLIDKALQTEIDAGRLIHNVEGWRAKYRQMVLDNERAMPGYTERTVAAQRAKDAGKRLTRCRMVRGTHGLDYVYDPHGTDEPPKWWSADVAKKLGVVAR
jgi:hypothetical protein